MARRKMCYFNCPCPQCMAQREVDRRYTRNRRGTVADWASQKPSYRRAVRAGLTEAQVTALEEACGNLCEICRRPERVLGSGGKVKALAVDHDHETGEIRGLLCNNCNRGLGLLGHDLDRMEMAVAYLRKAKVF